MNKKWVKVLGLSLALPSTTIGTAYICNAMYQKGILSRPVAVAIFIAVVVHILLAMSFYAYSKKN